MCSGCGIFQKILRSFRKKNTGRGWAGEDRGFARVFEGGFGKMWCAAVVFCGEVVVDCVVNAARFVVDFKR
jgi:hypothetical protein